MPRQIPAYDELQIRLTPGRADAYHVEIRNAADASAHGAFRPPSELELEAFRLTVDPARARVRGQRAPRLDKARKFGDELFQALVSDEGVREVFATARRDAEAAGRGLRVTLFLSAVPELAGIPWEFLYRRPRFLAQSVSTPVVRYLDLEHTHPPLVVRPPLRILGMISRPKDDELADLDFEREQANLARALKPLIETDRVELRWLPNATLRELQREVAHGEDFHVFHYIGHGEYDERTGEGSLVLERPDGRAHYVGGEQLGGLLCDRHTLRLAILNACEAATTASHDPLAGVAAALVEYEVPAVVGMQFAITDDAAITFAEELYATLADGFPIDAAVTEARRALSAESDVEWATPVLFMRVPDGQVFDLGTPARPRVRVPIREREPEEPAAVPEPRRDPQPDVQRRRRRRLVIGAIGAAAAAVVAAAVAVSMSGGGGGGATGEQTWKLAPLLGGPERQLVLRLAAAGTEFIAAGIANGDQLDAALWSSRDGSSWARLPAGTTFGGARNQTIGGVYVVPGSGSPPEIIASGHDQRLGTDDASAWIRAHGRWTEEIAEPGAPGSQAMHRVAAVPDGSGDVLGAGSSRPTHVTPPQPSQPAAWLRVSPDTWEPTYPPSAPTGGEINGIAPFHQSLVAVGWLEGRAQAWTFARGAWSASPMSPARETRTPGKQVATDIIAYRSGLVAVGYDTPAANADAAAWLSDDGVHWTRAAVSPQVGDQTMYSLAPVGDRLIAVGYDARSGQSEAAVWSSRDGGRTWREAPRRAVEHPAGTGSVLRTVAVGRGIVLAGGSVSGGGSGLDGAIWRLEGG